MELPSQGWKKSPYVNDSDSSKITAEFRAGIASLGNREASFLDSANNYCDSNGRVVWCPACDYGENSESHVVIVCEKLKMLRDQLHFKNTSFSQYILSCKK